MAILGAIILLNEGRTQTKSLDSKTRTELYQVTTDGVGDGLDQAMSHVSFLTGTPHPTSAGLFLQEPTADPVEGDNNVYIVTTEWSTNNISLGGGVNDDIEGDPIDYQPHFAWSNWSHPEGIIQDVVTSGYIQNTATDPVLNPPLQEDLYNPACTVTVNQRDIIQTHLRDGVGRMNLKPFVLDKITIPPFCAKLIDYSPKETNKPNSDDIYYQSTYSYQLNFEKIGERTYTLADFSQGQGAILNKLNPNDFKGFRRKVLNAGLNKFDFTTGKSSKISDGTGGYISEPVPLDSSGQPFKDKIALGQEIYLLWNTLETVDFTTYPTKKAK